MAGEGRSPLAVSALLCFPRIGAGHAPVDPDLAVVMVAAYEKARAIVARAIAREGRCANRATCRRPLTSPIG